MKLISGQTKYLNIYTNLLLCMKPNQNSPILAEVKNTLDYFMHYKKKKYLLGNKRQNVKKDQRNLIGKNSNNEIIRNIVLRHIFQDGFLVSKLSSFLKKV